MKPKTMILMVVAVVCGLGASYMTSKLLANRGNNPPPVETTDVLVATARIPSWQPIKEPEKVFTVKKYPVDVAPRKAISKLEDVKDKSLSVFLDEGKPLTEEDLVGKDSQDIAAKIMPGQRAIAIKVTAESLAGGFIRPGSRVDIICTIRSPEVASRVILQNMLILAVDQTDTKSAEQKTILGSTATLAATLDEGSRLSLAASMGELRLLVRRPDDQEMTENVVARLGDLSRTGAPKDEGKASPSEGPNEGAKIEVPTVPEEPKQPEEPKPEPKAKPEPEPKQPEEKPVISEPKAPKGETKVAKKDADPEEAVEPEEEVKRPRPARIVMNPPQAAPTHTIYVREGSKARKEQVNTRRDDDAPPPIDDDEAPAAPKKDEKANPQPKAEQPRNGPQPQPKNGPATKTGRTRAGQ